MIYVKNIKEMAKENRVILIKLGGGNASSSNVLVLEIPKLQD